MRIILCITAGRGAAVQSEQHPVRYSENEGIPGRSRDAHGSHVQVTPFRNAAAVR